MTLQQTVEQNSTLEQATPISRRTFTKALIAVPFAIRAQQGPLRARIKIDTERTIGEIDPKIMSLIKASRTDCIDRPSLRSLTLSMLIGSDATFGSVKEAESLLRWPAETCIELSLAGHGPRDKRPPPVGVAWGTSKHRFAAEFLKYA